MKNNAYFDEMDRIGCEWTRQHKAHEARKEEIIKSFGWDSAELKAWYEEDKQMQFPISNGAYKAYIAWAHTIGDEVLFDDFCWDREIHDFIDTLRKAGMKTFVITNKSTALMENLHGFASEGCRMEGLCTITQRTNRWGDDTEEQIPGIRIIL